MYFYVIPSAALSRMHASAGDGRQLPKSRKPIPDTFATVRSLPPRTRNKNTATGYSPFRPALLPAASAGFARRSRCARAQSASGGRFAPLNTVASNARRYDFPAAFRRMLFPCSPLPAPRSLTSHPLCA